MIKFKLRYFILTAGCLLLAAIFTTCSKRFDDETGMGILSINLNSQPQTARNSDIPYPPTVENGVLEALVLIISLEGPVLVPDITLSQGVMSTAISLAAGYWDLTVLAYYEDEIYAEGSIPNVEVMPGRTSSARVEMSPVGRGATDEDEDEDEEPDDPVTVAVTGVSLDASVLTLFTNHGVRTLTATVSPADATNQAVFWSSSDTTKAVVDQNGRVTPVAVGETTITVTTIDGNITASCTVTVTTSIIEMVAIPAGTFKMGSPAEEKGRLSPRENYRTANGGDVTVSSFSMGKYPVTQAQYWEVMELTPGINQNRPMVEVSWYDAIEFCSRLSILEGLTPAYILDGKTDPAEWGPKGAGWDAIQIVAGSTGYRLPTEAQWEYACRAGTTTAFNDGVTDDWEDAAVDELGWHSGNRLGSYAHDVGGKAGNEFGLYDMHGNVFEWCWDWMALSYDDAGGSDNPLGAVTDTSLGAATDTARVTRGGSWLEYAQEMRSARRGSHDPLYGYNVLGFRLVLP